MKKSILFGLILLILSAIANVSFASELYGTVWESGRPVSGTSINSSSGGQSRTDTNGYYSISLKQGNHTLIITLPDGRKKECDVYVYPQGTGKNLNLESCR